MVRFDTVIVAVRPSAIVIEISVGMSVDAFSVIVAVRISAFFCFAVNKIFFC